MKAFGSKAKFGLKGALTIALAVMTAAVSFAVFSTFGLQAEAKSTESEKASTIFFYSLDNNGKSILLDTIDIADIEKMSHGQTDSNGKATGKNYYYCGTDNYPTTQYMEAEGITIPELVEYVKKNSTVSGANRITYKGDDAMSFMSTDSYGNYAHKWTYNDLYGTDRYYFEDLYNKTYGWKSGWEVSGEDNSKKGITLDEYNSTYKNTDAYYNDKRKVFETGEKTEAILATKSISGRTTGNALVSSSELGIADEITANGGKAAGCLASALQSNSYQDIAADDYALRLCVPMTEADLMAAHRTTYDNFKWVYNVRLDMASGSAPSSKGTVADAEVSCSLSSDKKTLNITMSCPTKDAKIYYSFSGSPQTLYTGVVQLDVSDRDLDSTPITIYTSAVKEGYDDGGVKSVKYPTSGVRFKAVSEIMTGTDLVFTAEDSVSDTEWKSWASAISGIGCRAPGAQGMPRLDKSQYTVDIQNRTITIDKSAITASGSYSLVVYATGYANKSLSTTAKGSAPQLVVTDVAYGEDITITFADANFGSGAFVYIAPVGSDDNTLISSSYVDKTQAGKIVIKGSYCDASNSRLTVPGRYTLEVRNSSYSPSSQTLELTVNEPVEKPDEITAPVFEDVAENSWYHDAVSFVTGNGYFNGTSTTPRMLFSPDAGMTRGMFVTVLGRLAGIDQSIYAGQGSFSDVITNMYYAPYVRWASQNNIVSGTGNMRFSPESKITREQMAVIMYKYVTYKGINTTSGADKYNTFTDTASVSSWAKGAMIWATQNGIINGSDGKLNPAGTATRAQVAQIIKNFSEKYNV